MYYTSTNLKKLTKQNKCALARFRLELLNGTLANFRTGKAWALIPAG